LSNEASAKIRELIYNYFQLAKTKDLERIREFLIGDERFTKFGDSPPYDRRDFERALMLEQLQFASISDYEFRIEDMKIDLLGDTAVATFMLHTTGMVVDDYSFRGFTVNDVSRITIVLYNGNDRRWQIVHQHFSKLPR